MKISLSQVQCPNLKCHKIFFNNTETFCPECGTRLPALSSVPAPGGAIVSSEGASITTLDTPSPVIRFCAFAIDVFVAGLFTPLLLAPIVGQFLCGIVWALYFLFRDMNGSSIGKLICGIKVVSADGRSATIRQRILRNVIFVLPDLAEFIPGFGIFLAPGAFICIVLLESAVLLARGRRLGDSIAGTIVVKRSKV